MERIDRTAGPEKKLIEAARAFCAAARKQGAGPDESADDARMFGLIIEAEPDERATVWPENWPIVQLFIDVQTQWRRRPDGRPAGLDYQAVEAVMRMRRLRDRSTLLSGIQVMEAEVLDAFTDE